MNSAGQASREAQGPVAGGPGGQEAVVTQVAPAARKKSKIAGHSVDETHGSIAGNGADQGQMMPETHEAHALVRATIDTLIEVGRRNDFAIRQRMRIRQATLSHIARSAFGYHTHLSEAERKRTMDAAAKLVKAIRAGEEHQLSMLVHATDATAAPWEEIQSQSEKEMVKLARKLPAHELVRGVRGFGDLSFARIIVETGDLTANANFPGSYTRPAQVWKRLGLAVIDGRAQRRIRNAEEAKKQKFSPERRAMSWVSFDKVWRLQSSNAWALRKESGGQECCETQKEDAAVGDGAGHRRVETHIAYAGPYRLLYDQKKAEYLERVAAGEDGWTKLRAHRAAKRYAEKRLLRDLWISWQKDAGHWSSEAQPDVAGDGDRGGQAPVETQNKDAAPVAAE